MTGFLTRVSTRKSLFMTTSLRSSRECRSEGGGRCGENGFSIRAQEKFSQILMPQVVNRSRKDLLDHVAPFFGSRHSSFIVLSIATSLRHRRIPPFWLQREVEALCLLILDVGPNLIFL